MSRYNDYTVEIGTASKYSTWTEPDGPHVLRVFAQIMRIPSEKRFVIHPFKDATPADLARAQQWIDRDLVGGMFRGAELMERVYHRYRRPNGTYKFSACFGRLLDDPAVQLELELMIDAGESLHAS